jgi:hypothetical protein
MAKAKMLAKGLHVLYMHTAGPSRKQHKRHTEEEKMIWLV